MKIRQTKAPVFIVGEARSGTSILFRALQQQDAFRINAGSSGECLSETRIFGMPHALYDTASMEGRELIDYCMNDQTAFETILSRVRKSSIMVPRSRLFRSLWARSRKYGLTRLLFWRVCGLHRLVRIYFETAREVRDQRRILDKSTLNIRYLDELYASFPEAQCLYIYRQPLEVLASYRKRKQRMIKAGVSKAEMKWTEIPAEHLANRLSTNFQIALNAQQNKPNNFMMLNYADLTCDPESVMKKVMHWLGESAEEVFLPSGEGNRLWEQDPKLFRGIQAADSNWAEYVSLDEAECIESKLKVDMQKLGLPELNRAKHT